MPDNNSTPQSCCIKFTLFFPPSNLVSDVCKNCALLSKKLEKTMVRLSPNTMNMSCSNIFLTCRRFAQYEACSELWARIRICRENCVGCVLNATVFVCDSTRSNYSSISLLTVRRSHDGRSTSSSICPSKTFAINFNDAFKNY